MGKIIEGVWDCPYCGTKAVRGSIQECPHCGKPRGDETTFYINDTHRYVPDAIAEKLNKKPDWFCKYCDSFNSDENVFCASCGAVRSNVGTGYFEIKREKDAKKTIKKGTNSGGQTNIVMENNTEKYKERKARNHIRKPKHGRFVKHGEHLSFRKFFEIYKKPALIITSLLLLIALPLALFLPRYHTVTVQKMSWYRDIPIESYQTVQEHDWTVPKGGHILYTCQEIRSYKEVLDHYETRTRYVYEQVPDGYERYVSGYRDLGNGYFEDIITERPVYTMEYKEETYQEPIYTNKPVYDTMYYYEMERWTCVRNVVTWGDDKCPVWGEAEMKDGERKGDSIEEYKIVVDLENGNSRQYTLPFDQWNTVNVGDTIRLKTYLTGYAEIIFP